MDVLQDLHVYLPQAGTFAHVKTYPVFLSAANTIGVVNTVVVLLEFKIARHRKCKNVFVLFVLSYL